MSDGVEPWQEEDALGCYMEAVAEARCRKLVGEPPLKFFEPSERPGEKVRIEHGDCLEVIPRLVRDGVQIDAVVTDPPYNLTPTAKRFGKANSAPAQHGRDGAMARLSGGFMGLEWDSTGISFRPETWATVATIMRPGGFLLAFGGTRTHHRMVCAIEDAGFVIQDTIAWLYGSGFPKRRDMLKPAHEPIVVAYKPGGKRTLQVDECRIAGLVPSTVQGQAASAGTIYGADLRTLRQFVGHASGRWPANLCHDGSDEVMDAFAASGDRPAAARFFYCGKAKEQDRWGSRHPTVKPVALLKWLVPLVTPPQGTVLDPFAGSGTTAVAAMASGRNAILIEREEQYIADIRARVAFYEGNGRHSISSKNRHAQTPVAMPLFPDTEGLPR